MPIDEVIDRLSAAPRLRCRARPTTRLVLLAMASGGIVAALSAGFLGDADAFGAADTVHSHGFLLNFVFMMSVAACALAVVRDLSVPARPASIPKRMISFPFVLVLLLATHEVAGSSLHEISREAGQVLWFSCFLQIVILAAPAFLLLVVGVRQLAPTDLRRTGTYIGMLSGAIGSMGHCWHIPTDPFFFGALIYVAAIGTMMLAGYLVGPRVLRWT